jgi:hypothetical protein
MRKVYLQVTLNIIASCDESVPSVDDIMERIDIDAVGDGEFVDVIDSEIKEFHLTDSK